MDPKAFFPPPQDMGRYSKFPSDRGEEISPGEKKSGHGAEEVSLPRRFLCRRSGLRSPERRRRITSSRPCRPGRDAFRLAAHHAHRPCGDIVGKIMTVKIDYHLYLSHGGADNDFTTLNRAVPSPAAHTPNTTPPKVASVSAEMRRAGAEVRNTPFTRKRYSVSEVSMPSSRSPSGTAFDASS